MGKLIDFVKKEDEPEDITDAKQQFLDLFTPEELNEIEKDLGRLADEGGDNGE